MNLQSLGENIDLTAVAAQTAVDLAKTSPYLPGKKAVGVIEHNALAGAAFVGKIQTSPDNSTWTDAVVTGTGVKAPKLGEFTLDRYVRANVTVAGTAGLGNFYILVDGN